MVRGRSPCQDVAQVPGDAARRPAQWQRPSLPPARPSNVDPKPSEGGPGPAELAAALEVLRDEMRDRHEMSADAFARVRPRHRRSAENLVDSLTLRSRDMRPLQEPLTQLGVSSLGRSEEHVVESVERVVDVLRAIAGDGVDRHGE